MLLNVNVDTNNPANYKPCVKKIFDAYLCKPEVGTYAITMLGKRNYRFTSVMYTPTYPPRTQTVQASLNAALQSGQAFVTTPDRPFVLYDPAMKDCQVLSLQEVQMCFTFMSNGTPCMIDQNSIKNRMTGNLLDWQLVKSSKMMIQGKFAAMCVSNRYVYDEQTINGVQRVNGIPGLGNDFLVCPVLPNGMPDFSRREVVHAASFKYMYNNKGWTDKIPAGDQSCNINSLPPVIVTTQHMNHVSNNLFTSEQKNFVRKFKETIKKYENLVDKVIWRSDCCVDMGLKHKNHAGKNILTITIDPMSGGCSVHHELATGKVVDRHISISTIASEIGLFRTSSGYTRSGDRGFNLKQEFAQACEEALKCCDGGEVFSETDARFRKGGGMLQTTLQKDGSVRYAKLDASGHPSTGTCTIKDIVGLVQAF